MNQANSSRARLLVLLLAVAALSIAAVACGSDGGDGVGSGSDGPIAKIDATDRIYTADDIKPEERNIGKIASDPDGHDAKQQPIKCAGSNGSGHYKS